MTGRRRFDAKGGLASVVSASLGSAGALVGLCCIGPLGVSLFGVGGAVMLARLAPARPWILGLAVVLSAYAFWRLYLQGWVSRSAPARPAKSQHALFWVSTLLVLFAAFGDRVGLFQ